MVLYPRTVLASLLLFAACGGGQRSVSPFDIAPDLPVAEVTTDGSQEHRAPGDAADAAASEVQEIPLDGWMAEALDGSFDLGVETSSDLAGDGISELADVGCEPVNAAAVDLQRVLAGDGSVTLAALVARPGGGYIIAANTDASTLTWDGQGLAGTDCPGPNGCSDALVVWLDELLQVEATRRLGGEGTERLLALAMDEDGRVLAAGTTDSPQLVLGAFVLPGAGQQDGFAVAFDPAGEVIWARRSGGSLDDAWNAIAPDGLGGAVVGGWFESASLELGGSTLNGQDDNCILLECGDLMLAGIGGSGEVLWARAMGGNQGERFVSLHAGAGAFNAVGSFGSWGLDLGGDVIPMQETICGPMFGCSDIFAGSYSATGEHVWSKGFGGDLLDVALAGAPAPDGGLLLVGEFSSSSLDLGGGLLVNSGDHESFVARFNAQGTHQWSLQADAFLQVAASGPGDKTIVMGLQTPYQTGFADCLSPNVSGVRFLAGSIDGDGVLALHRAFGMVDGLARVGGLAVSDATLAAGVTFQGELTLPGATSVSASDDAVSLFLMPASLTVPESI